MIKTCAYCGHREATEKEHVIGRAFFDKPCPPDIITVPSCGLCNRQKWTTSNKYMSDDEEYMRTVLSMYIKSAQHPSAIAVFKGRVVRSVTRSVEERPGIAARLSSQMGLYNFRSSDGQVISNQPACEVEWHRFVCVLTKIARGLYYWDTNTALPKDYGVMVNSYLKINCEITVSASPQEHTPVS